MPEGDPPVLGEGLLQPGWAPATIDTGIAHPARIYDYYLGGKDNYQVDRDAAEEILAVLPEARDMARANRAFLGRAVKYLARKGVKQFLDIGTGIPGPDNTNDVAHAVQPEARVVYVDNDPIVLTHAGALLARHDPKYTTVIQADLRDPDSITRHPDAAAVLNFAKPIGVPLVAVPHFVKHAEKPHELVERLKQITVPGSCLVLSHGTGTSSRTGRTTRRRTTGPVRRSCCEAGRRSPGSSTGSNCRPGRGADPVAAGRRGRAGGRADLDLRRDRMQTVRTRTPGYERQAANTRTLPAAGNPRGLATYRL